MGGLLDDLEEVVEGPDGDEGVAGLRRVAESGLDEGGGEPLRLGDLDADHSLRTRLGLGHLHGFEDDRLEVALGGEVGDVGVGEGLFEDQARGVADERGRGRGDEDIRDRRQPPVLAQEVGEGVGQVVPDPRQRPDLADGGGDGVEAADASRLLLPLLRDLPQRIRQHRLAAKQRRSVVTSLYLPADLTHLEHTSP